MGSGPPPLCTRPPPHSEVTSTLLSFSLPLGTNVEGGTTHLLTALICQQASSRWHVIDFLEVAGNVILILLSFGGVIDIDLPYTGWDHHLGQKKGDNGCKASKWKSIHLFKIFLCHPIQGPQGGEIGQEAAI